MKLLMGYLLLINTIGFVLMGRDKKKAEVNAWRVPERTLLGVALIGGGAGVWLGMETYHHKTKHWYFKYGVPAIFIIEIVVLFYLFG